MLKFICGLVLSLAHCLPAVCQYYFYNEDYLESAFTWEIGVSAGAMNCLTDLGGRKGLGRKFVKDINWSNTRPCGGLYAAGSYRNIVGARLELAFGQVKATDGVLKDDRSEAYNRFQRNLNFRTDISELALSLELYPALIILPNREYMPLIEPYIFAGVGRFHFSPETYAGKSWLKLAGLHTEGQGFAEYPDRKIYKLTQCNIPLGLGVKYEPSPLFVLRLELQYRKLWTDYLDDVSKNYIDAALFERYFTHAKANLAASVADRRSKAGVSPGDPAGDIRGNPSNNDTYFSGVLKMGLMLGRQKR